MAAFFSRLCLFVIMSLPITYSYAVEIGGYRSAEFGEHEDIILDAIKKDFGEGQKIQINAVDERTGTKTIEVKVANFLPLNVPATVSYILGYKCHCLIQVSIVWQLPQNITPTQRNQALGKISTLVSEFSSRSWTGGDILLGRVSDEIKEGQTTNYIFFRGVALDHSAITVWGAPVVIVKSTPAQKNKNQVTLTANIDKLQTLGVNYELNVRKPDLKRAHTPALGF